MGGMRKTMRDVILACERDRGVQGAETGRAAAGREWQAAGMSLPPAPPARLCRAVAVAGQEPSRGACEARRMRTVRTIARRAAVPPGVLERAPRVGERRG